MRVGMLTAMGRNADELGRDVEARNPAINSVASGFNSKRHRRPHAVRSASGRRVDVHDIRRKGAAHLIRE